MIEMANEFVIEIVVENGTKQTWLFQSILFYYTDRLTIFVIEIVTDSSDQAFLVLKNSDWYWQEWIVEWTQLFQCTLLHYAE